MRKVRKFANVGALMFLLVSMLPSVIFAQDASSPESTPDSNSVLIALYPKDGADGERFTIEAKPGETVTTTAMLVNYGSEPIELRTYSTGIVPAVNGGLKITDRGSEKEGSALWMDFEADEFVLQSQEAIERNIEINVPEGTPSGEYVNAVVLETVNPVNKDQSGSFEQYFRKVVSVYITVPGELAADFEIGAPEVLVAQGRSGVQFEISNTGNIRIDVAGTVKLVDANGTVVHEGPVMLGPIYMGQVTYIQVPFAAVPATGDYILEYEFVDRSSGVERNSGELAVFVPEAESTEVMPISFDNVVVEPNADPVVFANVSLDITVAQATYRSTRLTLSVYHNGEHVEDFVLADNLSLTQGTTAVGQRYVPATGFMSGEYTFSLKLESTEAGETSLLFEAQDVATLEVP